MVYRLVFTRHSMKTIQKLDTKIKKRIENALRRIQVRPFDFVEKMINHPYYKLRLGNYRIIMDIINHDLVILVVEVGHRRNIYKRF